MNKYEQAVENLDWKTIVAEAMAAEPLFEHGMIVRKAFIAKADIEPDGFEPEHDYFHSLLVAKCTEYDGALEYDNGYVLVLCELGGEL